MINKKDFIKRGVPLFGGACLLVLTLFAAGCGGKGGASGAIPSTTTSGVVIDGYLQQATVCIDINANGSCDRGEPSDITNTNGAFTIPSAATGVIIAEAVVGITIDSDTGTTISKGFSLTAPAGNGSVITPLTSLVQAQIALDSSLTPAAAELALKTKLGIKNTKILGHDFIAQKCG